jgi:glycosyltransferase involved in cell wall biosynthesis
VTWGEVPRMSSVYNGQVVNVIRELKKANPAYEIKLLAGVPFIHSGMFREKLQYKHQVRKIRDALGAENFIWRNILVPPVGVSPKRWQLPLFFAFQKRALRKLLSEFKPDILHCRSYVATWIAHELRQTTGQKFKIVFDARSYMPDESVVSGRWALGSADYNFWKNTERALLANSDVTIAVSGPMKKHFDSLDVKRCEIVYLNVDCVEASNSKLKIGQNASPIFAYCGYLGAGGWHDDAELWKIFTSARLYFAKAKLLLITKSNHRNVEKSLSGSDNTEISPFVEITSSDSPLDSLKLLKDCNFGILSYRKPKNDHEIWLADGVFATKTAEYLVAGLPVIVNKYCGGASDFVIKNDCGICYDPEVGILPLDVIKLKELSCERDRISALAIKEFSAQNNAIKLTHMYKGMMGN